MKKSIKANPLPLKRKSDKIVVAKKGTVTVLTRKPYHDEDRKLRDGAKDVFLNTVKEYESNAYFRENIFGSELIVNGTRYTFPNKRGLENLKSLFIFKLVKKDATKYLSTHKIKPTKWQSPIVYNKYEGNVGKKIIGTDLDIAYWTIAANLGIISSATQKRGDSIPEKNLLQASLSSLGRDKRYSRIENGSFTINTVIIKGDDRLKEVYKLIRHTCYSYMKQLAKLLGKDFVAYKTDCIFYVKSEKNVKLVSSFFEKKELDHKQVKDMKDFARYAED